MVTREAVQEERREKKEKRDKMRKAREGGRESFRGGTKYLCSIWGTYHF